MTTRTSVIQCVGTATCSRGAAGALPAVTRALSVPRACCPAIVRQWHSAGRPQGRQPQIRSWLSFLGTFGAHSRNLDFVSARQYLPVCIPGCSFRGGGYVSQPVGARAGGRRWCSLAGVPLVPQINGWTEEADLLLASAGTGDAQSVSGAESMTAVMHRKYQHCPGQAEQCCEEEDHRAIKKVVLSQGDT
jgi:hypothetical protein